MTDPKESLCFALDVSHAGEALEQVEMLAPYVGVFKVGLQLFLKEGPALLASLHEKGAEKIFLDLKLLDIPRTVRQARISAGEMPVEFLSVHSEGLLGGSAEQEEPEKEKLLPKLLMVTILTSLSNMDIRRLGYRRNLTLGDIVLLRTDVAKEAGCAGVICSGNEVEAVRNRLGTGFLIVTPGIRPPWAKVTGDDQRRTRTARETIRAGADILVVGRPIRKAEDPCEAAKKVLEEIEQGHKERLGG